jgi:membrane-bound metal-dependent hydrolase YbcI (DUF457 family)
MDPISHVLFGQTLVTAVGRPPAATRARSTAAVLGALAPDADAVLMPFGWDIYLRGHEIGTHTVAGSLVLACLVAVLLRMFTRGMRFTDLWWPAWLGCLSHILLDIVSGARIQIAWPLPLGHVSLPLVAMAEPWLVAILVIGASAMAWLRLRRRGTAVAVLGLVGAFLVFKSIQLARALPTIAASAADAPVRSRVLEARWASLTEWYVFERQPDLLRQWAVRTGAAPRLLLSWPVVAESELVTRSRSLDAVRNFLAVHDLGFAAEVAQMDGTTRVLWSDLRYCWRPDSGAAADPDLARVLTTSSPAGPARMACGLWFGGSFDRDGRPLSQLVKVGGWWQTRPPAP